MAPDRTAPILLRAWLDAEELSQTTLAMRLGVHRSTVGQWIVGNNAPNRARRAQLERMSGGAVPAISWWRG